MNDHSVPWLRNDSGHLRLWAHRGSHHEGGPLENTFGAFVLALVEGADGIELDVHLSADGVPLVFHDETTRRLAADGTDWVVANEPADRLMSLPLRGGHTIPTLDQVLELVDDAVPVNVEIKDADALPAVLEVLRRRPGARILLSSFAVDAMEVARHAAPHLPRALLVDRLPEGAFEPALDRLAAATWHPCGALLTPARIAQCQQRGVQIHVWTVNDPTEALRLAALGVDGIFTDRAGTMRRALGR